MMSRALPLLSVLALAACGPLVQIGGNTPAPTALLSLRATAAPVPTPAVADKTTTVLVLVPAATGTLQTLRLPVATTDTEVAYLTGATWSEQPARQFQRVLADTIELKGVVVLDPRQATIAGGRTLSGTLMEFGLDVRDSAATVVRVRYDATLSGIGKAPLSVRRFDQAVPVSSQLPGDVAAALNKGANAVAADVATWVAGR